MDLYKKRPGTSGISGQLYETKLISLILFRLLHDDTVEEFYLASNMDEIGTFDDICIKIKLKNTDRPMALFIQVKHKDNDEKVFTLDNKNDIVKWFDSILKIKQKFRSGKKNDKIFEGDMNLLDCSFILYTNANYNYNGTNEFVCDVDNNLNYWIATSDFVGTRLMYTDTEVQDLSIRILNEELTILAKCFAKYLTEKLHLSMNIMNDEYILRYHVILAKEVVDVSDIQLDTRKPDIKWRIMSFRNDFFDTNGKSLTVFRKSLCEEIFKYESKIRINNNNEDELIPLFLVKPSSETLSPLIGTTIAYKGNKLEFISDRPHREIELLGQINLSQDTIDEAKELVARKFLLSLKLKVPVAFGNADIAIRGNVEKIENRLNYLTEAIVNLCEKSEHDGNHKIITIDETINDGLLSPNGGLGGCVGNILEYDDTSKLLMFSRNISLPINAQNLMDKLKSKITNLDEYRIDVKAVKFPKLTLDFSDTAKEFLDNFIIYAKQSNHCEVEKILKNEIENKNRTSINRIQDIKTEALFLSYHNEIQKWWMSPKSATYLTNKCDIYHQLMNNIVKEPQISIIQNTFYVKNLKYFRYSFKENVIKELKSLNDYTRTVIKTNINTLTVMKVIRFLKHNYIVLELEHILDIPIEDFSSLNDELSNTDKVVIIVCNNIQTGRTAYKRLDELSNAVDNKNTILVTDKFSLETINEYFPRIDNMINDEQQTMDDLSEASQKYILNNATVIFQCQKVNLESIVNQNSLDYIKGDVLKQIISDDNIVVGESLSNAKYKEIEQFYITRTISRSPIVSKHRDAYSFNRYYNKTMYYVTTFYDIIGNSVLITAKPGMGKSTLLTHLSLVTKKHYPKVWIIRINLLDHSNQFFKWKEESKTINTIEMVKFICQVIIKDNTLKINLKESNNNVYLDQCAGEDWTIFQLNAFLHCFNKGMVITLFDGFDEICPHYKNNVIKLFSVIKNDPRKIKVWVTSRPYTDILPDLERGLGQSYEIEYMTKTEQEIYLNNFWQIKLMFEKRGNVRIENIISFLNFMSNKMKTVSARDELEFRFIRIFYYFFAFLCSHFPLHIDKTIYLDVKAIATKYLTSQTVDKIMGNPLLLFLLAEYFVNIIDTSINEKQKWQWETNINVYKIYDMFIQTKLKKILFQDKNKMDVYNPDNIERYAREKRDCMRLHKKLAAYTMIDSLQYFDEFKDMRPFDEGLQDYENILKRIKRGTEKTGFISHVTEDNVPVFIHQTFAEYFAAEHLCDVFKSKKITFEQKRLLYTTILVKNSDDILPWIDKKLQIDVDLYYVIVAMENKKPMILTWYGKLFRHGNWSLEQYLRIMNSTVDDYDKDCFAECNTDDINLLGMMTDCVKHMQIFNENLMFKMKPQLRKYFALKY